MPSVLERPPGMESIKDRCPGPMLREHLKLDNNPNLYREILEKLRAKCQKYMAINQRPAAQKQALAKIESELKAELPDLFATDDEATYLALRTVMKYHYNRRVKERERIAKLPKEKKISRSGKEKQKMRPKAATIYDENDKEDTRAISISATSDSFSAFKFMRTSGATSSSQSSGASWSSQPSTTFSSRNSHARVPSSTFDGSKGLDNDSVYAFLANCVPSMAHLYPLFINFGCNSEEYLLGVSTWNSDAIEVFLRRVANQAPMVDEATQMGEMDLLILQNHFRGYFTV